MKPAFSEFVRPTLKYADIIVPRARPKQESDNQIAIDFIVHNLEHKLTQGGFKLEHTQADLLPFLTTAEQQHFCEITEHAGGKLVVANDTDLNECLASLINRRLPEVVLIEFMLRRLLEQMQKYGCADWSSSKLHFP